MAVSVPDPFTTIKGKNKPVPTGALNQTSVPDEPGIYIVTLASDDSDAEGARRSLLSSPS